MSTKKVAVGDYGPVLITKGPGKGIVGFYDDDDMRFAIVYTIGNPCLPGSRYVLKKHSSLAMADVYQTDDGHKYTR